MRFEVRFVPSAEQDLGFYPVREQNVILDAVARFLEIDAEGTREEDRLPFPKVRETLDAPPKHGVYVIQKGKIALHVRRTLRGGGGLRKRLKDHLYGRSSFTCGRNALSQVHRLRSAGVLGAVR